MNTFCRKRITFWKFINFASETINKYFTSNHLWNVVNSVKAIWDDLTLADLLKYARSLEITAKAIKILEEDLGYLVPALSNVNAIYKHQDNMKSRKGKRSKLFLKSTMHCLDMRINKFHINNHQILQWCQRLKRNIQLFLMALVS